MTSDTIIERPSDDSEPFAALAFKIATDPFVGQLVFFRVYSGVMKSGDSVYNSAKGQERTDWSIVQMHANDGKTSKRCVRVILPLRVGIKNVLPATHCVLRTSRLF